MNRGALLDGPEQDKKIFTVVSVLWYNKLLKFIFLAHGIKIRRYKNKFNKRVFIAE
jgi:hypothetical protein